MGRDIAVPMRQDAAAHKVKAAQNRQKLIEYQIENGDVTILTGIYQGSTLREMFARGPLERDYIVKHLCVRTDPELLQIIGSLCGK